MPSLRARGEHASFRSATVTTAATTRHSHKSRGSLQSRIWLFSTVSRSSRVCFTLLASTGLSDVSAPCRGNFYTRVPPSRLKCNVRQRWRADSQTAADLGLFCLGCQRRRACASGAGTSSGAGEYLYKFVGERRFEVLQQRAARHMRRGSPCEGAICVGNARAGLLPWHAFNRPRPLIPSNGLQYANPLRHDLAVARFNCHPEPCSCVQALTTRQRRCTFAATIHTKA